MALFMLLPDFLRLLAVRALKHHVLPTPCAADIAEFLRKVENLDVDARGDLIRKCETVCRESDTYRAKAIRQHGRNKRMTLTATGLSPPLFNLMVRPFLSTNCILEIFVFSQIITNHKKREKHE